MTSPSKQNESSERIKKILQGINAPAEQRLADLPEENSQKINEEVEASKEEIHPTAETELIPEESPEFSDEADALEKSSTSDENIYNGLSSDSTSVGSDSGKLMEDKDGDKIPENNSTEPIDSEIIVPVENGATVSEEMTGTNDAPNSETEGLLPLTEPSREETDSGVITETKEPIPDTVIKGDETDAQEASLEEPEPLAPKLPSGDETEPTFEGELSLGLDEEIPKEPEEPKEVGSGFFKKGKKPKKEKPKTEKEPKEKKEKTGLFSGLFAKKEPEIEFYDFTKHGSLLIVPEPEGKEVVEEYWIEEGCSKVQIVKDVRLNQIEYLLFEPPLTQFEHDLLERIYEDLRDVLILEDTDLFLDKKIFLLKKTARLYNEYGVVLEPLSHFKLQYYLVRNYLGWARLEPVLQDTHLEDISCDGFEIPLFLYHRTYQNIRTNIIFSEKELLSLAITLAQRSGKHISISTPILDATLPDGSRLQLTFGKEVTTRGTSFTIRKFRETPFTPVELLETKTFNLDMMVYFWLSVENNKSLIFVGGTASGKTTSLNAVAQFIPALSKIVSIEDTREVTLNHENWIASVTRNPVSEASGTGIDMFDLLKAAMRQRPEYIIVGEVRGMEAQTLFQAMNTGHTTLSTLHANDVDAAIHRIENPPLSVPRNMVQALDIVSIQSLIFIGHNRVRRSKEIVEIAGIDPTTGNLKVNTVFAYDPLSDTFIYTGRSEIYQAIMEQRGWSREQMREELDTRRRVLQAMEEQRIYDYVVASRIFQTYSINKDLVLNELDDLKTAFQ